MKFLAKLRILVKIRNCGKTSQVRCGKKFFWRKKYFWPKFLYFSSLK